MTTHSSAVATRKRNKAWRGWGASNTEVNVNSMFVFDIELF